MAYFVGLDLGKQADFTALAVVQTVKERDDEGQGSLAEYLHLRHLERYPLRTPYTEVADGVRDLLNSPPFTEDEYDPSRGRVAKPKVELLVDRTGVGEAVVDIFKERGLKFTGAIISSGEKVNPHGKGVYSVPKKDVVAALEVPFDKETLRVAEGLPLWPTLREELLNFRRKQNARTTHISFEHWREGDHDDLVLAAALACWGARCPLGRRSVQLIR